MPPLASGLQNQLLNIRRLLSSWLWSLPGLVPTSRKLSPFGATRMLCLKGANSLVMKSTKLPVILQKKYPNQEKADKNKIQGELRSALEILVKNGIELIICEYFRNILEMEWAIEVALEYGLPVGATMCMGPGGDESGTSVGECAVRMARAGAHLVGVNCLFDPFVCLDVIKNMKVALEAFELSPYLMAQPLGYRA